MGRVSRLSKTSLSSGDVVYWISMLRYILILARSHSPFDNSARNLSELCFAHSFAMLRVSASSNKTTPL